MEDEMMKVKDRWGRVRGGEFVMIFDASTITFLLSFHHT